MVENNLYFSLDTLSVPTPKTIPIDMGKYLVEVKFAICEAGDTILSTEWIDESESNAVNLASLLYCIHSGALLSSTVSILLQYKEQNPDKAEFVDRIMQLWDGLLDNKADQTNMNNNSREVIKPSQVLQGPIQKGKQ